MDIFKAKVWREGCNYMVGQEGDLCNKCGKQHDQTAEEAKQWPFRDKDKESPQG